MTAEGSINLQKVDTKVKDNDQNSDLTAKLKKKRQLPEVGGSSFLKNYLGSPQLGEIISVAAFLFLDTCYIPAIFQSMTCYLF